LWGCFSEGEEESFEKYSEQKLPDSDAKNHFLKSSRGVFGVLARVVLGVL